MKHSKPSHIFIVGVGRSGTKFIMNVLNNHSEVNICPETHFFSRLLHRGVLKAVDQIGDMQNDSNVKQLFDEAFSGKIFGTYWKHPISVSKENLVNKYLDSRRSDKELFEIIINEHRILNDKGIGGEKTPSHLFHVPELLKWFPNAKVIHIIRDPRAILASEINKDAKPDYPVKKRGFLYNTGLYLYVLIQWKLAFRLDKKYHKHFKNRYCSIRYEDLLNNHQETVQTICSFLHINFEENILNPPKVDSSFSNIKKRNVDKRKGFFRLTTLLLKKNMKKMGYFV